MTRVSDMIQIAKRGGLPSERLANAGDPDKDLKATSWLVHQFMLEEARRREERVIPGAEEGTEWIEWHGTLSSILAALHLASRDDELQLRTVRRNVSHWLRNLGNAVCLHRTNGLSADPAKDTLWAVRADFREVPMPPGLPIMSMITTAPSSRHAQLEEWHQPAPPPEPAPPGDRAEVTAAPLVESGRIACRYCSNRDFQRTYIARHVFKEHANATDLLLDAIRQRGKVLSTDLLDLLVQATFGGAVSTGFVTDALREPTQRGVIYTVKGWAGQFWYVWAATTPASDPDRPIGAVTSGVPVTSTQLSSPDEPPQEQQQLAAADVDVISQAEEVSPAAAPAHPKLRPVSELTSPGGDEVTAAIDALDDVVQRLRSVLAGVTHENAELRRYRDRVRSLLTD
jgi:hypothetical protein